MKQEGGGDVTGIPSWLPIFYIIGTTGEPEQIDGSKPGDKAIWFKRIEAEIPFPNGLALHPDVLESRCPQ